MQVPGISDLNFRPKCLLQTQRSKWSKLWMRVFVYLYFVYALCKESHGYLQPFFIFIISFPERQFSSLGFNGTVFILNYNIFLFRGKQKTAHTLCQRKVKLSEALNFEKQIFMGRLQTEHKVTFVFFVRLATTLLKLCVV